MSVNKKYTQFFEAILCSFALMVFSLFIRSDFPLRILAYTALLLSAWIFSRDLQSLSDLKRITRIPDTFKITVLYSLASIFTGFLIAILYRLHLGISLLPRSFHLIVLVAALIGCTEEMVFRGLIQDQLKGINAPFSILFSSISHTGYKCCLFLSPMLTPGINVPFLALWTLIGGILLGTIKHFSKSIFPPMIAHALFDILVYAEFVHYPWWVW
jgi:membrane protease YdiL (CAAX protease family)